MRRRPSTRAKRRRYLASVVVALTALPLLAHVERGTAASAAAVTEVTVAPTADARVLAAYPTTNFGSLSRLDVDNPGEQSFLRFDLTGVSGTVQRATLRLFVRNGSANGPSIYPIRLSIRLWWRRTKSEAPCAPTSSFQPRSS